MQKTYHTNSPEETKQVALAIGERLRGGETFEVLSDLGGGKTTFIKGLVSGFGSDDGVSSPSFTISFTYARPDDARFHHFDFYRLSDPGIMKHELDEVVADERDVVAIEWGDVVADHLPKDTVHIAIKKTGATAREITITVPPQRAYVCGDHQ